MVIIANSCDVRKGLGKAAEDTLPRFPRFAKPVILLDVIRPRLKELPRPARISRPDMASTRAD